MADAFTEANRITQQVSAIDRQRAVITTREKAAQDKIDTQRRRKQEDQTFDIRANQEGRAQTNFEDARARQEPLDVNQQKFQLLAQEIKAQQSQLDKAETFNAFKSYTADGDPRHINNLLKANPRVKKAFGQEIASVDKIDLQNDQQLLGRSGLDPSEFASEDAIKRFIKVTNADGTKDIVDINKIFAATGFLEQLDDESLNKLEKKARIAKLNRTIEGKPNLSQEMNDLLEFADLAGLPRPSSPEELRALIKLQKEISPPEDKTPTPTAAQKNIAAADERQVELFDKFGGEDGFFNTDFTKSENRIKAAQDIRAIEKLADLELSSQEKKKIAELSKLIGLAKTASGLGQTGTGPISDIVKGTEKFLLDNLKDVEARAAFSAFNNTFIHALSGAAVSPSEAKRLTQSLGTLKQKLGPVLQQLRVNINQVKTDLETVANTNDPVITKFRFGASLQEVSEIINALDGRLDILDQLEQTGEIVLAKPAQRVQSNAPPSTGDNPLSKFKFNAGDQ